MNSLAEGRFVSRLGASAQASGAWGDGVTQHTAALLLRQELGHLNLAPRQCSKDGAYAGIEDRERKVAHHAQEEIAALFLLGAAPLQVSGSATAARFLTPCATPASCDDTPRRSANRAWAG
ncbi:MAG: hypothetical protein WBP81_05800 [Solirubrobacteraceae bacterium]